MCPTVNEHTCASHGYGDVDYQCAVESESGDGLGHYHEVRRLPIARSKKADQLSGNTRPHYTREELYWALISITLGNMECPVILIS